MAGFFQTNKSKQDTQEALFRSFGLWISLFLVCCERRRSSPIFFFLTFPLFRPD